MTDLAPPTAAQIYLALDVIGSVPTDSGLARFAAERLASAMKTSGWTGKTADCAEYGKPPSEIDAIMVQKVRAFDQIMGRLFVDAEKGEWRAEPDMSPEAIADVRAIVVGATDAVRPADPS